MLDAREGKRWGKPPPYAWIIDAGCLMLPPSLKLRLKLDNRSGILDSRYLMLDAREADDRRRKTEDRR